MISEDRIYQSAPPWLRTVLLNLHALRIAAHRYGPPHREQAKHFDRMSRAGSEAIRIYQETRLHEVVKCAYERSQFYRTHWQRAGVEPADIRGLDDLRKLPLVRKDDLRAAGENATTERGPRRGWLQGKTSGTTGSPLTLWYDRRTCIANNAADRLQKMWAGVPSGAWIGMFLGRVVVPIGADRPPFWHANHVQRQVWFSSFHMSPANIDLFVGEIRRRRLQYLEGYPSTLFILAQRLIRVGATLPMKAVFTSSETMHDVQQEAIEKAFEAPVFDFYGHAERAAFAIQCENHTGKHIVEPYGVTEIVDSSGQPLPDGHVGYLVSTSLQNLAMPMVRYLTSDLSAIESLPCKCGRSFRRIQNISTKAEDIVVLPDGRWISPSILTHPFKSYPQIAKSQIVQETPEEVTVKVVAGSSFTADMESDLRMGLQERLGPAVQILIQRVDDIPREASGKYRWVISRVPHELRLRWSS